MSPADYNAWYDTLRGRWVGETEYAPAARLPVRNLKLRSA